MSTKLLNMTSRQVDYLNIGLIVLSLLIAFNTPFVLFLIAYAVLGPLHYLTEINWLRERQYFVQDKRWIWIAGMLSAIIIVPPLLLLEPVQELISVDVARNIYGKMDGWANGSIFIWLLMSIGLVITRRWYVLLGLAIAGGAVGLYLKDVEPFYLFTGFLVPTLIHVYLFTLLFMFYGTQKSNSKPGYIAIIMTILVPFIIILADINPDEYHQSASTLNTFQDNNFYAMNAYLGKVLFLSDGSHYIYSTLAIKLQIFIAYAYTYHYLNWFSKTSIIGWHKMSRSRSMWIIGLWGGMVALYAYDYKIGFFAALFLSFLHVLLEFPLNALTVKGIGTGVRGWFAKSA